MEKHEKISSSLISVNTFLKELENCEIDIIIPEKEEIILEKEEKKFKNCFHQVQIENLTDLQKLRVIPDDIDIIKICKAIEFDNVEAYELFKKQGVLKQEDCGCHSENQSISHQKQYKVLRKSFNPNLSNLFSEHYNQKFKWDNSEIKSIVKLIEKYRYFPNKSFDIVLFRDITVLSYGVLSITSSTNILRANDIKIHTGGKIQIQANFMNIRCSSLQGNI